MIACKSSSFLQQQLHAFGHGRRIQSQYFYHSFLEVFCPQLEYLLYDADGIEKLLSKVNFSKLTEFEAWNIDHDELDEIFSTAIHLRKLCLTDIAPSRVLRTVNIITMINSFKEMEFMDFPIAITKKSDVTTDFSRFIAISVND